MKPFIFGLLTMALFAFAACQQETINCRDNALGTYEEVFPSNEKATIIIKEGDGEKGVILAVSFVNAVDQFIERYNLIGELNDNCTLITIPVQDSPDYDQIKGSLVVTRTTLTGSLTFVGSHVTTINMTKQ